MKHHILSKEANPMVILMGDHLLLEEPFCDNQDGEMVNVTEVDEHTLTSEDIQFAFQELLELLVEEPEDESVEMLEKKDTEKNLDYYLSIDKKTKQFDLSIYFATETSVYDYCLYEGRYDSKTETLAVDSELIESLHAFFHRDMEALIRKYDAILFP